MYSTLLIINSKDRYSGTAGNFNYGLDYRGKIDITSFRVNKVTIPYSFYNVQRQNFTFNSAPLIMPEGSYTIYTLINKLSALITPHGTAVSVTYDADQNKIVISDSVSFALTFDQTVPTGLGFMLKIPNFTGVLVSSQGTVNMNITSNIYLSSQALTIYLNSFFNKRQSNVFQVIPVNTNSFGYIIWQNSLPTNLKIDNRTIQNIDIQVFDDYGQILNFNGNEIIIELELFSNEPF